MQIMKRLLLFLSINILIVTVISILLSVFNVDTYLTDYGLDIPKLAVFCLIYGMASSLVSLALSRAMAKWAYGVKLVDPNNCTQREKWLVDMVNGLCRKAGLTVMPEIGFYDSQEANAFATGPCKTKALVAVSSGLFNLMNDDEIEGVLGHEISHIVNDDMVTMTLVQGIINAFVMFISRVIAYALSRNSKNSEGTYYVITMLIQSVLLFLAYFVIAFYSRHRECRADDGGANLAGRNKMIEALEALKRNMNKLDVKAQPAVQSMKISGQAHGLFKWLNLSTHPPLEERIARLKSHQG